MKGLHYKGIGNTRIKPIKLCGSIKGWAIESEEGLYAEPIATEPTIGKHDFNSCKICQKTRKDIIEILTNRFNGYGQKQGFPFCCKYHANLTKLKEFRRFPFVSVPEFVADKILYTNQHIINNHQNEDYYKDITDYIDYTVDSFGEMPKDCGEPLYVSDYLLYIYELLEGHKEIDKERKYRLLEFIKAFQTPIKEQKTDLNILFSKYEMWLRIFPFEISFFAEMKPYFENKLPILNGEPEINKYSDKLKTKIHTKGSLIDTLLIVTKNLLSRVDIPNLRRQGLITDIQANQLEFADAELNTKNVMITKQVSKGELRYIKALKKWLKGQQSYFDKIAPILKELPPQSIVKEKTKESYKLQIRLKPNLQIFYTDEANDLFCYLVEKYAIEKRVVDYSNIYHWMLEKKLIKKGSGTKFKKMIVDNKLTEGKYSRMDYQDTSMRPTFNNFYKDFNNLIDKGVKFE